MGIVGKLKGLSSCTDSIHYLAGILATHTDVKNWDKNSKLLNKYTEEFSSIRNTPSAEKEFTSLKAKVEKTIDSINNELLKRKINVKLNADDYIRVGRKSIKLKV